MRQSTRFPAAVHILTMLAAKQNDFMSSDIIARSMDTNRVVVRRLISMLAQAGLVSSQAGVQGGARLEKSPKEMTLLEIYEAVEEGSLFRFHNPHPKCPVATCVTEDLRKACDSAEQSLREQLASKTLADVTRRGTRKMKEIMAAGGL